MYVLSTASHNPLSDDTIDSEVWSIIEHWELYGPDRLNRYRIKYLEEGLERLQELKARGSLDSYHRAEIKRIPEIEQMKHLRRTSRNS